MDREIPIEHICARCSIQFNTAAERLEHVRASLHHYICRLCNNTDDFPTYVNYRDHLHDVHLICRICQWPAASQIGLNQHNVSAHNMCPECKIFFPTPQEQVGHCSSHRPRNVSCYLCNRDFPTLSAVFNHLESSNCESGVTKEDIEGLANRYMKVQNARRIFCPGCDRNFPRMCDLLQHVETRSCQEGYFQGSGTIATLVAFIKDNIRSALSPPQNNQPQSSQQQNNQQQNNQQQKK